MTESLCEDIQKALRLSCLLKDSNVSGLCFLQTCAEEGSEEEVRSSLFRQSDHEGGMLLNHLQHLKLRAKAYDTDGIRMTTSSLLRGSIEVARRARKSGNVLAASRILDGAALQVVETSELESSYFGFLHRLEELLVIERTGKTTAIAGLLSLVKEAADQALPHLAVSREMYQGVGSQSILHTLQLIGTLLRKIGKRVLRYTSDSASSIAGVGEEDSARLIDEVVQALELMTPQLKAEYSLDSTGIISEHPQALSEGNNNLRDFCSHNLQQYVSLDVVSTLTGDSSEVIRNADEKLMLNKGNICYELAVEDCLVTSCLAYPKSGKVRT